MNRESGDRAKSSVEEAKRAREGKEEGEKVNKESREALRDIYIYKTSMYSTPI